MMLVPATTPDMFPGLLGDLIEATTQVTEAHPVALAAPILVGIGSAIGRDAYTYVGETRHGLNENVLIVGPTSTGRKGDGWNVAHALLEPADPAWAALITSGLHSGEGLIAAVKDEEVGPNKRGETVVLDAGISDKRLLVFESEFSQALKLFKQERNILSNVIRDAWDGKRIIRQMVKNSPLRATGAHISIIGHTTPEDLHAYLTALDVANGTGNRFLILAVDRVRSLANPKRLPDEARTRLVERVRAILRHATGIGWIGKTPAATELWESLYPDLSIARPGLVGALLARGPAHVTRLASLFSLFSLAPTVDVPHLTAAAAWWDYNVSSIERIFAGRTGLDEADRILAAMVPGETLTLTEIQNGIFFNHASTGRLRDALQLLNQLGAVRFERKKTPGRTRLVVHRLDHLPGEGEAA
jgi:hypothetical protein